MNTRRKHIVIITSIIILACTAIADGRGDPARTLYKEAIKYMKQGRSNFAFMKFTSIASIYPDSKYADEAHFRIGEYYFESKAYMNAIVEFKINLELYPESPFREQVLEYLKEIEEIIDALRNDQLRDYI